MIQAYLDSIKEKAAEIAIQYTNGKLNARLNGEKDAQLIANHSMRVIYLWGVIEYAYLVGTTLYIGGTAVSDTYLRDTFNKLWHFNGIYSAVDLSDYTTIVADDGDGGAVDPANPTVTTDHYRSGNMIVTVGANPVTFIKDGVASPLASNDYTVDAWAISNSGFKQNNVVVGSLVAAGFTAEDILEAGTLYYIATLNT